MAGESSRIPVAPLQNPYHEVVRSHHRQRPGAVLARRRVAVLNLLERRPDLQHDARGMFPFASSLSMIADVETTSQLTVKDAAPGPCIALEGPVDSIEFVTFVV